MMSSHGLRQVLAYLAVVLPAGWTLPAAGMEWSYPMALNSNAAVDVDSDYYPQVATDGQGNWVCVWTAAIPTAPNRDFDIYVARSSDDGATWSEPALLDPAGADPLELADDQRPNVYTDGAGHWIAVWYSYDSRGGLYGDDSDILVSRSTDNGATWTTSVALNSDAETDHLNYSYASDTTPELACDGNGNWVATFWTWRANVSNDYNYDVYVSRSDDHGATWSPMQLLHSGMATDAGEDTTVRIATDQLGTWVIAWKTTNLIGTNGVGDEDLHYCRSTDNGAIWSAPAALNTDADTDGLRDVYSGGLDLLTDGSLWVAVWVRELPPFIDYDLMISRSTDAGVTWAPPEVLNPTYAVDGAYKDLYPRLATDGAGGWVVIWDGYNAGVYPWGSDHDIVFMRSDDGAQTWSYPAAVNAYANIDFVARDEDPVIGVSDHGRWIAVWFSTYDLGGTIGVERDLIYATSCVPLLDGDADCDGDLDLDDFAIFGPCLSGPKEGAGFVAPSGACLNAFDFTPPDGDVDLGDFAALCAAMAP